MKDPVVSVLKSFFNLIKLCEPAGKHHFAYVTFFCKFLLLKPLWMSSMHHTYSNLSPHVGFPLASFFRHDIDRFVYSSLKICKNSVDSQVMFFFVDVKLFTEVPYQIFTFLNSICCSR